MDFMEIFGFETVDSLPALYHPDLDLLVVSDLHLGLEGSMTSRGSYVPQFQLKEIEDDIETAVEITGASRILVNGDLKNEFQTRYAEKDEIKEFLRFLDGEFQEVILVKGNHDTLVENTVKEAGMEFVDSHRENGILFTHGDDKMETLKDFETLVIGHEHPALALEDEVGITEKVACFLYGKSNAGKNIIVMPAFALVSNGTNINEVPSSELLSPILKKDIDKDEMKAVAVSREAGLFEFPEIGKF
jgi:putative SbcD/Mre11-related phosphoesterase